MMMKDNIGQTQEKILEAGSCKEARGAERWGWENHKQHTLSPDVIMLSDALYAHF